MSSIPLSNTSLPIRTSLSQSSSSSVSEPSQDEDSLEASRDARRIVRLAQCPQCSYPLQEPVTLPCGNSLCKKCIPELHIRRNISYPATPNRIQGFTCPFSSCGLDHAIGDCSVNVVLNKIMGLVTKEVGDYRNTDKASNALLQLEERDMVSKAAIPSLRGREGRTRVLCGGRLVATYTMAEMGELAYGSEVKYTTIPGGGADAEILELDLDFLGRLRSLARSELDCQVCYNLFLDPFTTTCGHTFCRTCLHRVLDHSHLCPVCRRYQAIPPGLTAEQAPSNILLEKLLKGLCPEGLAARAEIAKTEEKSGNADMDVPIFVCTLSFPNVPTFLHIFEPRYRLMIRRAIESGDRKFGMVMHNPSREPQGELGPVNFYQYGTLLHIVNMHLMHDGRSLIETIGVSRFKVIKSGIKDHYTIGKIERIDDITIAAEEALEARETSLSSIDTTAAARNFSVEDHFGAPPHHLHDPFDDSPTSVPPDYESMSTQSLFELSINFVKKMREQSAPWLHTRVFQVYGECPDDPAVFPWWFASVLPIADAEKYNLLATESVRERLKACARWIAEIERANCRLEFPGDGPERADYLCRPGEDDEWLGDVDLKSSEVVRQ